MTALTLEEIWTNHAICLFIHAYSTETCSPKRSLRAQYRICCKIDSWGLHGSSGLTWTLNSYHRHPQLTNKPQVSFIMPEYSSTMFFVPWISGTFYLSGAPVRKMKQRKNLRSLEAKLTDRFGYVCEVGFFGLVFFFCLFGWLIGLLLFGFFLNDNVINVFIFTIRII